MTKIVKFLKGLAIYTNIFGVAASLYLLWRSILSSTSIFIFFIYVGFLHLLSKSLRGEKDGKAKSDLRTLGKDSSESGQ